MHSRSTRPAPRGRVVTAMVTPFAVDGPLDLGDAVDSQPGGGRFAHAPVPRGGWRESAPFPQPSVPRDAAERGRERYAAEQAPKQRSEDAGAPGAPEAS